MRQGEKSFSRWLLVLSSALLMAVLSGVWYCGSVLLVPLMEEYGRDYAGTSLIFSLFTISYGASAILVGRLVDRFGPPRVIASGGILVLVSLVANSLAGARWQLYLTHGILAAVGVAGIGYVPVAVLLTRHFDRERGLALGIASAGAGVGIFAIVPLTHVVSEVWGWRFGFLALAGASSMMTLLALWIIKRNGSTTESVVLKTRDTQGSVVVAALATRAFWVVLVTILLTNCPIMMLMTHHVAHIQAVGQHNATIAGVVSIIGVMSIPGKVLWGYLSDLIGPEPAYALGAGCFVGAVAALLCLQPSSPPWALYAYGALMGLGYSVGPAMPSIICGRYFGGVHFGTVFGLVNTIYNIASGIGVWLGGYSRDVTGSYRAAFVSAGLSVLIGAACAWLGPRHHKILVGSL